MGRGCGIRGHIDSLHEVRPGRGCADIHYAFTSILLRGCRRTGHVHSSSAVKSTVSHACGQWASRASAISSRIPSRAATVPSSRSRVDHHVDLDEPSPSHLSRVGGEALEAVTPHDLVHGPADTGIELGRGHEQHLGDGLAQDTHGQGDHGEAKHGKRGGVDVRRDGGVAVPLENPRETERGDQGGRSEPSHQPALRVERDEGRLDAAILDPLVRIDGERDDRRDSGVRQCPTQDDLVASAQQRTDRAHERIQAQQYEHAAVERERHGLDMPIAVLEAPVVLSDHQPGDEQGDERHRHVDEGEQAVEQHRHRVRCPAQHDAPDRERDRERGRENEHPLLGRGGTPSHSARLLSLRV